MSKSVFDVLALVPVVSSITKYLSLWDICALIETCNKLRVMWRIKPDKKSGTFEQKANAIKLSREWRKALRIVELIKSTFDVEVDMYKNNPFDKLETLLRQHCRQQKKLQKQKQFEQLVIQSKKRKLDDAEE